LKKLFPIASRARHPSPPRDPWLAAAGAIRAAGPIASVIVGPPDFSRLMSGCVDYARAWAKSPDEIGCLVVHKGMMNEIPRALLDAALWAMRPIYANEVFVVLARGGPLQADPIHMASFYDRLASLAPSPAPTARIPPERAAPVYLGDRTALLKTVDGLKLYVDTRDVSLAPHLLVDGAWERWVTDAVKRFVKPGMRVADIGANVGYYSTLLARIVGPEGWVHCFEPNPTMYDLLFRGMEVNGFLGRSQCHRLALWSAAETRTLKMWRRHPTGSSFYTNEASAARFNDLISEIDVETARLDDVLENDLRLDFIKIDAEGSEIAIVDGARRVLAANHALQLIVEYSPARDSDRPSDLLASFRAEGFLIATIEEDGTIKDVAPADDAALLNRRMMELYLRRG
jgi:FkbM family methyltransferase